MGDADEDFQAKFRKAKAARNTAKMSKDQIRALKAKKPATTASAQPQSNEDRTSMPPPPPRHASVPPTAAHPKSYHADSQGTRLNEGGGIAANIDIHSEPSVNKGNARPHQSQPPTDNNTVSLAGSNLGLAQGLFDQGTGSTNGIVNKPINQQLRRAKSGEGSTGFGLPVGLGTGSALQPTSQLSGMAATEAASQAIGTHATTTVETNNKEIENLPTGFFDASLTSHAQPQQPPQQHSLDDEYAEFMKQLDDTPADDKNAHDEKNDNRADGIVEYNDEDDEENAAQAKLDTENFKQFVRMERLRELREAAAKNTTRSNDNKNMSREDGVDEGDDLVKDILGVPLATATTLSLPKKRKVSTTVNALLTSSNSGDEDEDDDDLLNWRAKRSIGIAPKKAKK